MPSLTVKTLEPVVIAPLVIIIIYMYTVFVYAISIEKILAIIAAQFDIQYLTISRSYEVTTIIIFAFK